MALNGNLTGSSQFFSDELFYNDVATQSLRLDNSASSLLTRTPSAGNRKTWTWSAWIKRGDIGRDQDFFTAEGSGGQLYAIMITSGNQLQIYAASAVLLLSNQLLRDVSAWYHIVVKSDTTQGTASDRLKIYLNGSEITSFATDNRGSYAQNTDYGINSNVKHNIGSNQAGGNFGDYYIAEVNFVDGTAYDASHFGETKNGVWIPKKYTGSYGTQGFHLEFKQTGDGSSTASSSTIGADTANSNHYKDTNLDAYDSNMPDSPENNFPTLSPIAKIVHNSPGDLSDGNLKFTLQNANCQSTFTFNATQTGKYYWEVLYASTTANNYQAVTLPKGHHYIRNAFSGSTTTDGGIALYFDDGTTYKEGANAAGTGGAINAGSIIQFKLDLDNQTLQFGVNNSYITALDLPASSGGWIAGGVQSAGTGATRVLIMNYGQDSSFVGEKTAQGNSDANGIGDFYYAVPSGFLAVCTANLPEPAIGPTSDSQSDDNFNTVLYTGSASSPNAITGVGFQPDWVWIKKRSAAVSHAIFDSSRGVTSAGATNKAIGSDRVDAEGNGNGGLSVFGSDGFTLVDGTSGSYPRSLVNDNATYVAWNWKANGGTTSSNTDGDVTSTVQANTTAGFSIVIWTQGSGQTDVGHGLGAVPDMIIGKTRTPSSGNWGWHTFHKDLGVSKYLFLNATTAATTSSNIFNPVNSTVFGSSQFLFQASTPNVAYCFKSVEGYSKFGIYFGNGNADGTFVHLGFRPAWVMLKRTDSADDWEIMDSKRSEINGRRAYLFANTTDAEATSLADRIDFLSNGFKARVNASTFNTNGGAYIYMAFAEAPFKYANAR